MLRSNVPGLSAPRSVLATVLLLALSASGWAQVTTGTISGVVKDPSDAVVANASVSVIQEGTGMARSTKSDSMGQYSVPFLGVGKYAVRVEAPGFRAYAQSGILLDVGRQIRLDVVLQMGAVSDSVSVTADPPAINTTSASLGRTVSGQEVTNLPLVNRNLYSLLNLTPGVSTWASNGSVGSPEQETSVNGSGNSMGAVSYFLDGGKNSSPIRNTGAPLPNPDAVEEFRVITNSFGAEFGRFAGGVVDVVTKSGTNAFHGSLFEYLRNDKLNAKTWNATTATPLRRNQFGGSIGGPIRANRTFFFGSYAGLRQRQPTYRKAAIPPTEEERAGSFTNSLIKPTDPATKLPYAGSQVPKSLFDPVAMKILAKIPYANAAGGYYEISRPQSQETTDLTLRFDHSISSTHQVSGSYFRYKGTDLQPMPNGNVPWSDTMFQTPHQNINVSETWTVKPELVNQFRLSYQRYFTERVNTPGGSLADFGSSFVVQGTPSLPRISVGDYFTLGNRIAGPRMGGHSYGMRDMLNWSLGRHTIKMGGELMLDKILHYVDLENYGVFSFNGGIATNRFAEFLLGRPANFYQQAPTYKIDNSWYSGLYIQDDFRVSSRLTLNLGVRWDLQAPLLDPLNRKTTFAPGVQSKLVPSAPVGILFAGDPGIPRGIASTQWASFSPRVGFAYDLRGNGRTAIRGAFGLFYGSMSGSASNTQADRQPFAFSQTFYDVKSLTEPYANNPGGSPFPYEYNPAAPRFTANAQIGGINRDFRLPYNYQMNLTAQHEFAGGFVGTASYVGTLGHLLPIAMEANYPVYNSSATSANVNARRPYLPGILGSIQNLQSIGNTAYHGLQTTVERRMSKGLMVKGYYVFGKTLDSFDSTTGQLNAAPQNYNRMYLERGRPGQDRRHSAVFSAIWTPVFLKDRQRLVAHLMNGWAISGIASFVSGAPMTISTGSDTNLDGNANERANYIGGVAKLDPSRPRDQVMAQWFNTAAFVKSLTGQEGTSGRGILETPGGRYLDLALARDFRLLETVNLQFKAEATNALNTVNLSGPSASLSSRTFGVITGAGGMRNLQLGLRLTF